MKEVRVKRGELGGSFALLKVAVSEKYWSLGCLLCWPQKVVLPLFYFQGNLTGTCMFVCMQMYKHRAEWRDNEKERRYLLGFLH